MHTAAGEKAHQEALAKFSPEAKDADAKINAIADDKTLTAKVKQERFEAIINGLSKKVRDEIENAMKGGH